MILTLNPGSSSLRYALYPKESSSSSGPTEDSRTASRSGKRENLGGKDAADNHSAALDSVFQEIQSYSVEAIGCRVVHGGSTLTRSTLVTPTVIKTIRDLEHLAPIHNVIAANLIESCRARFPDVPVFAVFDTTFHHSLPPVAATYALPLKLSSSENIRRFGFHGLAHQSVWQTLSQHLAPPLETKRVITCHLGGGGSICAIRGGQSMDTSMGLTPLSGIIMGTRSGDLDPGVVLHLIQHLGMAPEEVDSLLNHQSGLLGLSQQTGDMRTLEQQAQLGDASAQFAIECYAYSIAKYIASYCVPLGGLDAIAFSGGIGENSSDIRARVCEHLSFLSLELDSTAKQLDREKNANCISHPKSPISVWAIEANENNVIAEEVRLLRR